MNPTTDYPRRAMSDQALKVALITEVFPYQADWDRLPELLSQAKEMGAEVVFAPRCTPPQSYERWRLVLRANAVTSGSYVISTNRPAPTPDGLIGGPSIAIGPSAEVLVETTDPLALVTLDREVVRAAKKEYPGYLKVYPELYARGWEGVR